MNWSYKYRSWRKWSKWWVHLFAMMPLKLDVIGSHEYTMQIRIYNWFMTSLSYYVSVWIWLIYNWLCRSPVMWSHTGRHNSTDLGHPDTIGKVLSWGWFTAPPWFIMVHDGQVKLNLIDMGIEWKGSDWTWTWRSTWTSTWSITVRVHYGHFKMSYMDLRPW